MLLKTYSVPIVNKKVTIVTVYLILFSFLYTDLISTCVSKAGTTNNRFYLAVSHLGILGIITGCLVVFSYILMS